jgi:uncharacterized Zn finger protein
MNINCLHEHISPSAYAKGKELLRNGRVKSVSYESNDTWSAEIMELELYMMEIVFDEDELIHWYCDCNYKPGTMCRHIAAFILYLRRIWSDRYFLHGKIGRAHV